MMREESRRALKWLVAGALGLVVSIGPTAADNHEVIKLRVPVQLKKMLAEKVKVICEIQSGAGGIGGLLALKHSEYHDIINGNFDQVVEVVLTPSPGSTFAHAKSYLCSMYLKGSDGSGGPPFQGTPPNKDLVRLARPDEFFRQNVTGQFGPGAFVGAKDLKALQPKKE